MEAQTTVNAENKIFKSSELDLTDYNGQALSFSWYYRYQKDEFLCRNKYKWTPTILSVKNNHTNTLNTIAGLFSEILIENSGAVVIAVPSSTPNNTAHGATNLAQLIAQKIKLIDGTSCLKRTSQKSPSKYGNRWDTTPHKNTIAIENIDTFKGKDVLLIDDINSSGTSLSVYRSMLIEKGAKRVICITLGQTLGDEQYREIDKKKFTTIQLKFRATAKPLVNQAIGRKV